LFWSLYSCVSRSCNRDYGSSAQKF
jgi:hypothetical protein